MRSVKRQYGPGRALRVSAAAATTALLLQFCTKAMAAGIGDRPVLIGAVSRGYAPHTVSRGLKDGLIQRGYQPFTDFVIGDYCTRGDNARLPGILRQMIDNGSHILVVMNEQAAIHAQEIAAGLPVLFAAVSDPLGLNLVNSFAAPGKGVTGVASLDHEAEFERLKRFKQLVPNLKRVLYTYQPGTESQQRIDSLRKSARQNDIDLIEKTFNIEQTASEFYSSLKAGTYDGIITLNNASLGMLTLAAEASQRTGIPLVAHTAGMVDIGALASYGESLYSAGRQLSRFVDKIIRGADANVIPVEVNRKFEFVINLKVAHDIGLQIPPDILYQADRIVR